MKTIIQVQFSTSTIFTHTYDKSYPLLPNEI